MNQLNQENGIPLEGEPLMIYRWQEHPHLFHEACWSMEKQDGKLHIVFTSYCLN